jgi:hypothetical protein
MKYHEQDSHAPNGIELRDSLAHSIVGRKGSAPLPREAESIVEGLPQNIRNVCSITNQEGTSEILLIQESRNHSVSAFCHGRPTFLQIGAGRMGLNLRPLGPEPDSETLGIQRNSIA